MSQVAGAFLRGFLVILLALVPALLLPGISQDVSQGVTLVALIAGIVVVVEYTARHPGLIEFRDAKPYNRGRFLLLFTIILALTLMQRQFLVAEHSAPAPAYLFIGSLFDFSVSPVRLLTASLPPGLSEAHLFNVHLAASMAFLLALLGALGFLITVWLNYWPSRASVLNVWVNLPNFDPTKGIDVVHRLEREGQFYILLGIILPFSLPVLLHVSNLLVQPLTLETPLSLVWGVGLWAFVPISLVSAGWRCIASPSLSALSAAALPRKRRLCPCPRNRSIPDRSAAGGHRARCCPAARSHSTRDVLAHRSGRNRAGAGAA